MLINSSVQQPINCPFLPLFIASPSSVFSFRASSSESFSQLPFSACPQVFLAPLDRDLWPESLARSSRRCLSIFFRLFLDSRLICSLSSVPLPMALSLRLPDVYVCLSASSTFHEICCYWRAFVCFLVSLILYNSKSFRLTFWIVFFHFDFFF